MDGSFLRFILIQYFKHVSDMTSMKLEVLTLNAWNLISLIALALSSLAPHSTRTNDTWYKYLDFFGHSISNHIDFSCFKLWHCRVICEGYSSSVDFTALFQFNSMNYRKNTKQRSISFRLIWGIIEQSLLTCGSEWRRFW